MNELTKNRILQEGDEYLDAKSNNWKLVPKLDFGLQIAFTKYDRVRRKSEDPFPTISNDNLAKPVKEGEANSPQLRTLAESNNIPRSGVAPVAGESPTDKLIKALLEPAFPPNLGDTITLPPPTKEELAAPWDGMKTIKIKDPKAAGCTWVGRNGHFNNRAFVMTRVEPDKVKFQPVGKRGIGTCHIEIPMNIIPQVVEWLNKQKPTT